LFVFIFRESGFCTHPENQTRVLSVPAVTTVVGKEAPRELVVLVLHENTDTARLTGPITHILLPDDRQEKRAGGIHDCDIRQEPMAIILLQEFDDAQEEGVLGDRAHGVVGDTSWRGTTHPRGVSEERIQAAIAALGSLAIGEISCHMNGTNVV
jgi:hypothetical protein